MKTSLTLPVIIPKIADQRWSCHSCGNCCRTLVVHLSPDERARLDRQGWAKKLGADPYVGVGSSWALNKRPDGSCVFLDDNTRCKIHLEYGAEDKPFACKLFPFSVRAVSNGWQASLRFDCPSVASSNGEPISRQRADLTKLVEDLVHAAPPGDELPDLTRGLRATSEEVDTVLDRFSRWLRNDRHSLARRLVGAARITTTLEAASLANVRGQRLTELLDLLFGALPQECESAEIPPTARQRGMLYQCAFAHAEHVSLAEMRSGWLERMKLRWQQLGSARRFRIGAGSVPALPGCNAAVTFDEIRAVQPAGDQASEIEELISRYLQARIESRSVFGGGYYRWPVFRGLAALWLSTAVAGWLARYRAASMGRTRLSLEDVSHALAVTDRAATRLPALGAVPERTRLSYLFTDDGLARLVHQYSVLDNAR